MLTPTKKPSLEDMLTNDARKKGRAFGASKAVMRDYTRKLRKLSTKINSQTDAVLKLLKRYQDKYEFTADSASTKDASWDNEIIREIESLQSIYKNAAFKEIAQRIARAFVFDSNRYNLRQCKKSFGFDALSDRKTQQLIERKIKENVNLIVTIPEEHFSKIRVAVNASINSGASYLTIAKEIRKIKVGNQIQSRVHSQRPNPETKRTPYGDKTPRERLLWL